MVTETAQARQLSFVHPAKPHDPSVQSIVPLSLIHGDTQKRWAGLDGYWRSILLALAYLDPPLDNGLQGCRALVIGLGGGLLPLVLSESFSGLQVDVVELDGTVVDAARRHFGVPEEGSAQRFTVHTGDGLAFIRNAAAAGSQHYDVVFLDAFDFEGEVTAFIEPAVLCAVENLLRPGGGTCPQHMAREWRSEQCGGGKVCGSVRAAGLVSHTR